MTNTTGPTKLRLLAETRPCLMVDVNALHELAAQWEADRAEIARLQELAYLGEHHFPDLTYKARNEELRAALERERMELVSASVSVSRARELTLAQEIRANNLSAALERARALVAELAACGYECEAGALENNQAYRDLAALLAAASGGAA